MDRKRLHAVPPSIYVKKAKAHKDLQDNTSKRRAEPFVVTTPQENFSKVERFGEALSEFIDISILPLEEVYDEKLILTYRFQHIHQTVQLSYLSFFPKFVEIDPRLGYSI